MEDSRTKVVGLILVWLCLFLGMLGSCWNEVVTSHDLPASLELAHGQNVGTFVVRHRHDVNDRWHTHRQLRRISLSSGTRVDAFPVAFEHDCLNDGDSFHHTHDSCTLSAFLEMDFDAESSQCLILPVPARRFRALPSLHLDALYPGAPFLGRGPPSIG